MGNHGKKRKNVSIHNDENQQKRELVNKEAHKWNDDSGSGGGGGGGFCESVSTDGVFIRYIVSQIHMNITSVIIMVI